MFATFQKRENETNFDQLYIDLTIINIFITIVKVEPKTKVYKLKM